MKRIHGDSPYKDLRNTLMIDCKSCSGLCCVALYFSKSEGFPTDKAPGTPCPNLAPDFRCSIHRQLADRGLRGCMAFDCIGAGQKVTQHIFQGHSWRTAPDSATQIYEVFLRVWRLHQVLWYLVEASCLIPAVVLKSDIETLVSESCRMTALGPADILTLDIDSHQTKANSVLKKTALLVQQSVLGSNFGRDAGTGSSSYRDAGTCSNSDHRKKEVQPVRAMPMDYMGKNLKKSTLDGRDLSMALLIASDLEGSSLRGTNLLGADMRDTNLKSADLRECIFLTQGQINTSRGNVTTKLPPGLVMPDAWLR